MIKIAIGLFLALLAVAPGGTQTRQRMAEAVSGDRLAYWLHVPEGDAPEAGWPVLMFLHGAGERGDDLEEVKAHGPPKLIGEIEQLRGCVVVSPQCPTGGWWKSTTIKGLFDEVLAGLDGKGDVSRLYCTGLSMGGYGTWGLIANYPELLAAAAPICGGGDILRLKVGKEFVAAPAFDIEKLKRARELPIWAFHGAADELVPQAESQLLVDALKSAGSKKVEFTSYPDVGHDSWTRTYNNPEFYTWMFAQKRGG